MNESKSSFNLAVVKELLAGNPFAADLRYVPATGSTNRLAGEIPAGEWRNGTAIFTDLQTAGRGRRGRTWAAPACSSVLASVLLQSVPDVNPAAYVFIASLAVAEAIENVAGIRTAIKWPNDVHVGGRKLAGILIETGRAHDGRTVIGMGINANIPSDILSGFSPLATSILVETGTTVSREALAASLVSALQVWYRCLTQTPDDIFPAWKSRLDTLGQELDVHDSHGVWAGVAIDVQRDGGLIVERANGERRHIYAADVSVRPRSGLQAP